MNNMNELALLVRSSVVQFLFETIPYTGNWHSSLSQTRVHILLLQQKKQQKKTEPGYPQIVLHFSNFE